MNKNTKNYVCCRVEDSTINNLEKILKLLSEVTIDEVNLNYEISDSTHDMRVEIMEILNQVRTEIIKGQIQFV